MATDQLLKGPGHLQDCDLVKLAAHNRHSDGQTTLAFIVRGREAGIDGEGGEAGGVERHGVGTKGSAVVEQV